MTEHAAAAAAGNGGANPMNSPSADIAAGSVGPTQFISFAIGDIKPVPRLAQTSRIDFPSDLVTIDDAMIAPIDLPSLPSRQEKGIVY
jgi:hypothetical protein